MHCKSHIINRVALLALLAAVLLSLLPACGGKGAAAQVAEQPDTVPPRRMTLVFGGDVMQHMPQVQAAQTENGYDYTECFQYLKPLFDTVDVAVVNFETTVSANGRYTGYPLFSSPSQLAAGLRGCGVDVALLANNHICDRGAKGIRTTAATLDSLGIRHTGAFADSAALAAENPLMLDVNGIRLAILNYTYDTNGMPIPAGTAVNLIDTARMAEDIRVAGAHGADHIFACMHWGYEYNRRPSKEQTQLSRWLHAKGVEFVIGGHPHVVQPFETQTDTLGNIKEFTTYSLGNLVSNQRKRYTDGGIFVKIDILHRDSLPAQIEVHYLPVWVLKDAVGSKPRYTILPPMVADTMLKEGTYERRAYDIFMSDTRLMLGDSVVREMK